jgi:exopolysaccharide biosynthesis protein
MNTMDHQWFARIFYSEEKIEKIMSNNYFIAIDEDANLDDITIDTEEKDTYEDEYDKEILTRDAGNDLYKVINLKVGGSNAYLVAIYDPTKVHLISTKKFNVGTYGERIITMCERYGGVVCINGGGFVDNGLGSDIPLGYVIQDGTITWSTGDSNTTKANIIGMTKEGKLKLMSNATGQEALDAGIVDGLTFDPFLIVNGKAMEIVGDPWGSSPRMAIAQRKDGVILFLAIDGENYIDGASLQDMIDVLLKYKAYNAANLDGGTSSSLVINGELYNNPPAAAAKTNGRYVVTGWGLIP